MKFFYDVPMVDNSDECCISNYIIVSNIGEKSTPEEQRKAIGYYGFSAVEEYVRSIQSVYRGEAKALMQIPRYVALVLFVNNRLESSRQGQIGLKVESLAKSWFGSQGVSLVRGEGAHVDKCLCECCVSSFLK